MSHHIRACAPSALLAVVASLSFASAAGAQASATPSSPGGAAPAEPPVVESVTCRLGCAGLDRARAGSLVRLQGTGLDAVRHVAFKGARTRKDDRFAQVVAVTPTSADVVVPKGTRTGPLRAISASGQLSRNTKRLRVVGAGGGGPAVQARVDRRAVLIGGAQKAAVSFFVGGSKPAAVAVGLVRRGEDQPIATWQPGTVAPGTVGTVEWDGLVGGQPAPEGSYVFRVLAAAGGEGAQAAQTGQAGQGQGAGGAPPRVASSAFRLVGHAFPVQGPHDYGEFAASFGGGRGHQGQDVFATCGTPLVAAIGGKVKHVAFQERAGNYVVISGADGQDYAYMHLQSPTPLKKGQPVATGQRIGEVGDTGRASGCHLHFEIWTAPGWYTGGEPIDPLPLLKAWDTQG